MVLSRVRMKVAEPQILSKLQSELLKPTAADYIVKSVEKEVRKKLSQPRDGQRSTQRLLDAERRKLQNLVVAIEGGSDASDFAEGHEETRSNNQAP